MDVRNLDSIQGYSRREEQKIMGEEKKELDLAVWQAASVAHDKIQLMGGDGIEAIKALPEIWKLMNEQKRFVDDDLNRIRRRILQK